MDACVGRVSGQDSFQSDRELMIHSLKLCHVELGLNAVVCLKTRRETETGFCHHLKKPRHNVSQPKHSATSAFSAWWECVQDFGRKSNRWTVKFQQETIKGLREQSVRAGKHQGHLSVQLGSKNYSHSTSAALDQSGIRSPGEAGLH